MSSAHSLTYRQVGEDEAELLAFIHEECFAHYWNRDAFTDFFAVTGTFALLAEEGDQPVGMMVVRPQFEQADILTIAVRPTWRGQGIGRELVARALAQAAAMGAQELFLEVEDGNAAAIGLYEATGFVHCGRRKLYYRQRNGSFTDALVMKRKLD